MTHRKTISLTKRDDAFIAAQIKSGEFGNASEVIRAGLHLLEEHKLKLAELRALVDEGDKAYAEGRYTVVEDPTAFADDIVARGKARAAKPHA